MALYDLNNPYDMTKFMAAVDAMVRKRGRVEFKATQPLRTDSQNAYLHVLIAYFASEFGYSDSQVKEGIFKEAVNRDLFEVYELNKRGEEVRRIRSTSELDKAEMTLAITRFRNYSSSECGLYLPGPHEDGALFYARQQAEAYKRL